MKCKALFILTALAMSTTVTADYTLEDFILWDYRDDAPKKGSPPNQTGLTLPDYHDKLLQYCQTNAPPRLVLYVTDPCNYDNGTQGWLKFYDPTAGLIDSDGKRTFVGFLKEIHQHVSDVELLIGSTSFTTDTTHQQNPANGCWGGLPSGTSIATPLLPSVFARLPNTMGWLKELMSNVNLQGANPVTALALDPEGAGGTPEYVNILLWLDKYKASQYASPAVASLEISMTFGVEAHTAVKACVAELPAGPTSPSLWPLTLWHTTQTSPSVSAYYNLLNNTLTPGYLHWRPTSTEPLLQRAYLQVYSACPTSCILPNGTCEYFSLTKCNDLGGALSYSRCAGASSGEFWRFATDSINNDCDCYKTSYTVKPPQTIANNLVDVMNRVPAACGIGKIAATIVTAVKTPQMQLHGIDSILPFMDGYTRLHLVTTLTPPTYIPMSGNWTYEFDSPPATENTVIVQGDNANDSGGNHYDYMYTEISMDFTIPEMTTTSPDRIILMFSAEKDDIGLLPFFGHGTMQQYLDFIEAFYSLAGGSNPSNPVFMGPQGALLGVRPDRFAIYDLKQICSNWNIGACGTILCTGDGTQDGEVNSADVLHAINYWGTNDTNADHDENGTVDIKDLLLVIHNWGLCG